MPAPGAKPAEVPSAHRGGGVPGDTTIRPLAERDHNVVHWAEFSRGGHFAAMEAPDLLVSDVQEFFRQFRHPVHSRPGDAVGR